MALLNIYIKVFLSSASLEDHDRVLAAIKENNVPVNAELSVNIKWRPNTCQNLDFVIKSLI